MIELKDVLNIHNILIEKFGCSKGVWEIDCGLDNLTKQAHKQLSVNQ